MTPQENKYAPQKVHRKTLQKHAFSFLRRVRIGTNMLYHELSYDVASGSEISHAIKSVNH